MADPSKSYPLTREISSYSAQRIVGNAMDRGRQFGGEEPGQGHKQETPQAVPDLGFWAVIGKWHSNDPPAFNQQYIDARCYQWQEAEWFAGERGASSTYATGHNQTGISVTNVLPMDGGRSSKYAPSYADPTQKVIIDRAREVNGMTNVPAGTVVWLSRGADYWVDISTTGTDGSTGVQTVQCTEWLFSYKHRAIRYELWENLYMLPQAGVTITPNPNNFQASAQKRGYALAYDLSDYTGDLWGGNPESPPLDASSNPITARLIVVVDMNEGTYATIPGFIGLGKGYISNPGADTPEWTYPDSGWAVYWGDFTYEGSYVAVPHYRIISGRSPRMIIQNSGASFPGGTPDMGPGKTVALTGVSGISGTIWAADTNGVVAQWYEAAVGYGFMGVYRVDLSYSENTWAVEYMLKKGTAKTFVATNPAGVFTMGAGIDGASLVTAGVTAVGNLAGFAIDTDALFTVIQTGKGTSLTDPDAWDIIAVQNPGIDTSIIVGTHEFVFTNGILTNLIIH